MIVVTDGVTESIRHGLIKLEFKRHGEGSGDYKMLYSKCKEKWDVLLLKVLPVGSKNSGYPGMEGMVLVLFVHSF